MPRRQSLMLAGKCPKCHHPQETAAELDADNRPRLTGSGPCQQTGCPGVVRYRRQPSTAAAPSTPQPQQTEPRRQVRRYRRDATPQQEPEPSRADVGDGGQPEPGPGGNPELADGGSGPEPGEPVVPPERRRRYSGLIEPGRVVPGIY